MECIENVCHRGSWSAHPADRTLISKIVSQWKECCFMSMSDRALLS